VLSLADLPGGGPPFHPNCSKGTALFVPGASSGVSSFMFLNTASNVACETRITGTWRPARSLLRR